MNINTLTLALAKSVPAAIVKKASGETDAGVYAIDELVRIKGTVTKGEDFEQVQHMKVDQWAILTVALDKLNGVTMESLVRDALSADKDAVKALKARTEDAVKALKAPTKTLTAGKVTGKITFERVSDTAKLEVGKEAVTEVEVETTEA